MDKITEIDWARLAAYVDGEGCFSIIRVKAKNGVPDAFGFQLSVSNTSLKLMDWLEATFGGSVYPKNASRKEHKPGYQWQVNGYNAYKLIANFKGYLIIKLDQAEIALKFLHKTQRLYRNPRPIWSITLQNECYQKMRELNKTGVERSEV